ncbi:hypothetical protein TGPRC2_268930 [Toxoplasma gondii TgCatPRC2]|uniref:Uncharacterized protein n=3 Tax=Toxoplasma gondii TaxID=5811 RepID=A0A151HNN5_TOXGO|nr:hypothetical protein TGME49_268930 [Toxoplasma gondii ME49]EPT28283.1 hypothetical protein TGME49_268930 [Toxoplasma gondii ME49]KYF47159.1 hypothetical protein TGARI_268930 [Toxoplasma gondii ARI]KYK70871.1 hypothetical protein TGPRC2_268930 [Toxoplasma gondii TgCatPRC2]|eukprot:XP_018636559.1 hypothetical protein TGME49_268930 [Toxoplasma gondii ME49]
MVDFIRNHTYDLHWPPPLLRGKTLRVAVSLLFVLHNVSANTAVPRCGQTAATSPVSVRHLGEEDSSVYTNLMDSVSVPPSVGQTVDAESSLKKLLDWERVQQTIQDIASVSDLPNSVENAALYGILHDKLERLRERLAEGFQGSYNFASATVPVSKVLCSEQPNARGCTNDVSSGTQGSLIQQASSASFVGRVSGLSDADASLNLPFEGLVTSLPVQIQEQIQKNLQIEQAILEHKLLMQQLALNKQIEEFRKDVAFEEWLDFWNQLGPQVYDQPVPEDTTDDTEASELLERLASRYPQLFEDQTFTTLPSHKPPLTIQNTPLFAAGGTQSTNYGRPTEDRRSALSAPAQPQTYRQPPPPQAQSIEYSNVQMPLAQVAYSESRQEVPSTLEKRLISATTTATTSVNQSQYIGRFVQQPEAGPDLRTTRGQFEFQPSSSLSQTVTVQTPRAVEDTSLKAMAYTDKKVPSAHPTPTLRGIFSNTGPATDKTIVDPQLDQNSMMVPSVGAGAAGLLDSPIFGRHSTSFSREKENTARQEISGSGPFLNLITTLRDMLT